MANMHTTKLSRGLRSALTSSTHDPVAEYVQEFRDRSKECICQMNRTVFTSISQWIDASVANASAPATVLYQGIPTAVIRASTLIPSRLQIRSRSSLCRTQIV